MTSLRLAAIGFLAALPARAQTPPPASVPGPDWIQKSTADLILLDKIRAQPTPMTIKVGDQAAFGSMTIHVTACLARAPDQPSDSTAFLDVADPRAAQKQLFRGWIFANTPSISQIEDPVYDVRLAQCR